MDVDIDVDVDVDIDVDIDALVVVDTDVDIDVDVDVVTDVDTVTDVDVDVDTDIDTDIEADPGGMSRLVSSLNTWLSSNANRAVLLGFLSGPIGSHYIAKAVAATSQSADPHAGSINPTQLQGFAVLLNYIFASGTTAAQAWQTVASFVKAQNPTTSDQKLLLMQILIAPNQAADAALATWNWPKSASDTLIAQVASMAPSTIYPFMETYQYQSKTLPVKVGASVILNALNSATSGWVSAFNTVGVTDDATPSPGNYDGAGYSYSAEALAAAAVRPGGTVTSGGTTFIWPDVASGQHDTVTAAGQVIQLSGQGSTLSFLGSGTFGTQGGTITITYTDGSTSAGKITYADWCAGAAASGSTLVTTTAYRNYRGGKQANPLRAYLYAASIPLTAARTSSP